MSKPVKKMIMDELKQRYGDVDSACIVDITGLTVQDQQSVRAVLREKSGRLEIMKNALARKAFRDTALEPLGSALTGPCALVTSPESLVDVAKLLVKAAKEFRGLELREAILEGDPELATVAEVSKMKGRLELIGEIAMLVSSPGRALAGCMASPQGRIAGCLKTLAEKEN
ncbi:MAG: 50S ribosomal protein L10 [Phycisphaerae bacterium]